MGEALCIGKWREGGGVVFFFEKVKGGKKLREVTKWSFLGNVKRDKEE